MNIGSPASRPLLARRRIMSELMHQDESDKARGEGQAIDRRIDPDGDEHAAHGEQHLPELERCEEEEEGLDQVSGVVFLRRNSLKKPPPATASADQETFQNLTSATPITARRPSFFAAKPPISAARPYSATRSVAALKSA